MSRVSTTMDATTMDQLKQFKDFITNYNKLTDQCFSDCIFDFTGRSVSSKEETCATNCVEKYLKMNQRISQRFQEAQMLMQENMMKQQQQ